MKKFNGIRNLEAILEDAELNSWIINQESFDLGGDWIIFHDLNFRNLMVKYNVCNGWFFVFDQDGQRIATHASSNLDGHEWYDELLELFYEPFEEAESCAAKST